MPANVVKNKSDEKKWKKAKAAAKQNGEPRWPLVVHIFKQMSKTDDDKNSKIERALAGQGKKTTIPPEAHEALHAWWQSNKATALTPEQHKKLAEIKEVKQKRSSFKVVKTADKIKDLLKKIRETTDQLNKANEKRRSSASDWEPSQEHSPEELMAIDRLVDEGYHPREAAHIIANGRTGRGEPRDFQAALRSSVRPTMLSDKMLEHAKDVAKQWLENNERYQAKRLDVEKNPVKVASAQAKEAHGNATADYESAYNNYLKSDDVKNLKGLERHKTIQAWKAKWKADNPEYENKLQEASEAGRKSHADAEAARAKHIEDVKAHLAGGFGPGEGDVSAQDAVQHLGGAQSEDEPASGVGIATDPAATFAAQNKEFIEQHIRPTVAKPSAEAPSEGAPNPAPEAPKEEFKPKMVVRRMAKPEQLERLSNIDAIKASKKQE